MDHRDWEILRVLYSKKNITKAAESLYISQPALTHRLKQLEKEFGTSIVYRRNRGVDFTPQGEYLVQYAEEMLLKLRQTKEFLWKMDKQVTGTLRLGVSQFFTKYKLPGLLQLFHQQYPQVEFKVLTNWSHEVCNSLYNQEVHIGFIRGDYPWQGQKKLLFDETISIVSKEEIHLNELPRLPRINYQTNALFKTELDNWWRENYTQPPLIGMEVDTVDTCKEMVINGLGYAILPRIIVEHKPDLFVVDIRNSGGQPLIRKTWMCYHKRSLELPMVRSFVHFVEGYDFTTHKKKLP